MVETIEAVPGTNRLAVVLPIAKRDVGWAAVGLLSIAAGGDPPGCVAVSYR